jgi:hypothetical protein
VLFRSQRVRLERYAAAGLLQSDHRPVYAVFALRVRVVLPERRFALYRSLERHLPLLEEEVAGSLRLIPHDTVRALRL